MLLYYPYSHTYNCGTWGLKRTEIESLDAFHRRQLRHLIGVFYPNYISNAKLYTRCQADPISAIAKKARWRLFGHILRIPANVAMTTYFESRGLSGRVGTPRTTLPVVLNRDLKEAEVKQRLQSKEDLEKLRQKAIDRDLFNELVDTVAKSTQALT